jgi:hypothetical protein
VTEQSSVPALRITEEMTITSLGKVFAESGMFKDAKTQAQAIVKIIAGQEMGMAPVEAMRGLYVYDGRVSLAATTMAARLRQSGRYDFRVIQSSEKACEIEFWGLQTDFSSTDHSRKIWEKLGRSVWTIEMARDAGLLGKDVWQKYPEDMLYSRAMSRGVKKYCPDIFGGPVYSPEESEGGDLPESPLSGESLGDQLRAQAEDAEVVEDTPTSPVDRIVELEAAFNLTASQASRARVKYLGTAFLDQADPTKLAALLEAMEARWAEEQQKAELERQAAAEEAQAWSDHTLWLAEHSATFPPVNWRFSSSEMSVPEKASPIAIPEPRGSQEAPQQAPVSVEQSAPVEQPNPTPEPQSAQTVDQEATVRADAATMEDDALRSAITDMERALKLTEPQIKALRKKVAGKQSLIPMTKEQLTDYYVELSCDNLKLI